MIKRECKSCGEIHEFQECPKCKERGGYMQEPKLKVIGSMSLHLQETIKHKDSGNEYKIKEFQKMGIVAILTKTPVSALTSKRVYISNSTITEYTRK